MTYWSARLQETKTEYSPLMFRCHHFIAKRAAWMSDIIWVFLITKLLSISFQAQVIIANISSLNIVQWDPSYSAMLGDLFNTLKPGLDPILELLVYSHLLNYSTLSYLILVAIINDVRKRTVAPLTHPALIPVILHLL